MLRSYPHVLMYAHKKSVCLSASSLVGVSDEPYIPAAAPGPEAGGVASDHTFAGRCADARALVDRALVALESGRLTKTTGMTREAWRARRYR